VNPSYRSVREAGEYLDANKLCVGAVELAAYYTSAFSRSSVQSSHLALALSPSVCSPVIVVSAEVDALAQLIEGEGVLQQSAE
jgi:hypothetical protein